MDEFETEPKKEGKKEQGDHKRKPEFKNKGTVSAAKQNNKREYKEARKKLKQKKKQGLASR